MNLPENYLGGDLFWWQEQTDLHTLITIRGDIAGTNRIDPVELGRVTLTFALFDPDGKLRGTWEQPVDEQQTIFVDSRNLYALASQHIEIKEGVLAVFVSSSGLVENLRPKYNRLYGLIDWYSDKGDLVSLHSDQSFRPTSSAMSFTEIVLLETNCQYNFLVILNGPQSQHADSLRLQIKNHRGQIREAVYRPVISPFSLHKLHLMELFPGLVEWSEEKHTTLSGQYDCRGVFIRPYVMTQGRRLSGYHGGNLYQWNGQPRILYQHLGHGEVNPMVALHNRELTTIVNLLNTQADLEDDFWVDARLYDQSGSLVVERQGWLLARRHQLNRGEITDLLPDSSKPFTGHLALNFSPDNKAFYPGRLQALAEYRSAHGAARVMFWSDIWNGQERLKSLVEKVDSRFAQLCLGGNTLPPAGVTYQSYYRMWFKPPLVSYLAVTNCGITPDYDRTVTYRVRLEKGKGAALIYEGSLPPQGTDYGPINQFFPGVGEFLETEPVAIAVVESESDLAIMHLTQNQVSGVYSAEHFMDAGGFYNGKYYAACGS